MPVLPTGFGMRFGPAQRDRVRQLFGALAPLRFTGRHELEEQIVGLSALGREVDEFRREVPGDLQLPPLAVLGLQTFAVSPDKVPPVELEVTGLAGGAVTASACRTSAGDGTASMRPGSGPAVYTAITCQCWLMSPVSVCCTIAALVAVESLLTPMTLPLRTLTSLLKPPPASAMVHC